MPTMRKWLRLALGLTALLVVAQIVTTAAMRTRRMHSYLTERLQRSFGRAVHADHFNLEIFPSPSVHATRITVGEDPAFGYEYFLRAENLTARLRWLSLLRGHFDFGTLSLDRPSLTLVRNAEGRWNLEGWLPPATPASGNTERVYGPPEAKLNPNHLRKIEFGDGRVNFKSADVKMPFAFTGVSGSVEQIAEGRWRLLLEAQPWRSGVSLQSTGIMNVRGDLAGTSARLQPAEIFIRWDKVSIADLFRLLRGRDYGMRGTFALEATASSGTAAGASTRAGDFSSGERLASGTAGKFAPGDWGFFISARASQIHRWDLGERSDNPRLSALARGRWNAGAATVVAEEIVVEAPQSRLRGAATFSGGAWPLMDIKIDSAGLQAADALDWYRAFSPNVAEGISAEQYLTGSMALHGWPLQVRVAEFSSPGGLLKLGGMEKLLRIGEVRASYANSRLAVEPVRILLAQNAKAGSPRFPAPVNKRRQAEDSAGEVFLSYNFFQDRLSPAVETRLRGRVQKMQDALDVARAFGRPLNPGWELTGAARADVRWRWQRPHFGSWSRTFFGTVDVDDAHLQVAGLNHPLLLDRAGLEWKDAMVTAQIARAEAFGGIWTGSIARNTSAEKVDDDARLPWKAILHADHLDAAELDRWVGPRARPSWLQRLLPATLRDSPNAGTAASELVRRVNATAEIHIDLFTMEKLSLEQLQVQGSLQDLRMAINDAQAQWAGGKVRAKLSATFLPRPAYDVTAELTNIDISQIPMAPQTAERIGGSASAVIHLAATGVGREELLQKLTGAGNVRLKNVALHGWDLNASVLDGQARSGNSEWSSGDCFFTLHDQKVSLDKLHLKNGDDSIFINGNVTFAREADLFIHTVAAEPRPQTAVAPRLVKIVGPLDGMHLSVEGPSAFLGN